VSKFFDEPFSKNAGKRRGFPEEFLKNHSFVYEKTVNELP